MTTEIKKSLSSSVNGPLSLFLKNEFMSFIFETHVELWYNRIPSASNTENNQLIRLGNFFEVIKYI